MSSYSLLSDTKGLFRGFVFLFLCFPLLACFLYDLTHIIQDYFAGVRSVGSPSAREAAMKNLHEGYHRYHWHTIHKSKTETCACCCNVMLPGLPQQNLILSTTKAFCNYLVTDRISCWFYERFTWLFELDGFDYCNTISRTWSYAMSWDLVNIIIIPYNLW